jgi:hydrogenase 3 maturation protease
MTVPRKPPGGSRSTPAEALAARLADLLEPSSVIICVGDEMRGDDGAGPAVARQLAGTVPWLVLDAQNAPENFLMKVVNAEPQSVVLIDALHFGETPGAVQLIDPENVSGHGPSTHGPAPVTFLEALKAMLSCRQAILGIQPESSELGAAISEPVGEAVDRLVRTLQSLA